MSASVMPSSLLHDACAPLLLARDSRRFAVKQTDFVIVMTFATAARCPAGQVCSVVPSAGSIHRPHRHLQLHHVHGNKSAGLFVCVQSARMHWAVTRCIMVQTPSRWRCGCAASIFGIAATVALTVGGFLYARRAQALRKDVLTLSRAPVHQLTSARSSNSSFPERLAFLNICKCAHAWHLTVDAAVHVIMPCVSCYHACHVAHCDLTLVSPHHMCGNSLHIHMSQWSGTVQTAAGSWHWSPKMQLKGPGRTSN